MEVRVGDALASLRAWPLEDKIDLVFIDADKGGYAAYYEAVLGRGLLAPGGIIAIDNTLFKGSPFLGDKVRARSRAFAGCARVCR